MIARDLLARVSRACMLAVVLWGVSVPEVVAQLRDVTTSPLTANDGTALEMTSAVVRVPEQRTNGAVSLDARTIDLAVVRIRRAGAAASSIPHVILAGGPGDSGVSQVLGLAQQGGGLLLDLMHGDLIGIDQRGTGRSVPKLSSTSLYELPLDQPGSVETWLPIIERVSMQEAARFRESGITLEAYNTRESADDVKAVCGALGYSRVVLWGRSYGTHLALATVARHAALVERMVLVSPEGLDHTWKLPGHVDAILARLESRGSGDLVTPLGAVLDRLRRAPVAVAMTHPQTGQPVTIVIGAFDVQWTVAQALGDPRMVATLPAAVREMHDGDFRRMAQISLLRRERAGVQSAMKMMMDLSSGATPTRRARIDREAATALLGNAINFPVMYLDKAWKPLDLGDDFRRPVSSDVPTLIFVGDLDPRTPLENAREVASTLSRATTVVLENATHQFDLFGVPQIRDAVSRFLQGQRVPTDRIVLPPLAFK